MCEGVLDSESENEVWNDLVRYHNLLMRLLIIQKALASLFVGSRIKRRESMSVESGQETEHAA